MWTFKPLNGFADGNVPMDLCMKHYNSFKQVFQEWQKMEQGFMFNYPTKRTDS